MTECKDCIHFEVCAYASHQIPICDSYAEKERHGRWIKIDYACGETEYQCSECKETEWRTSASRLKYCPFCGAMMDAI